MSDNESGRASSDSESPSETIKFSYLKSSAFRVIHVDGAVAGACPGGIFISLYSERTPIPQQQVFNIGSDHKLAGEVPSHRVSRDGVIREVEVGLNLSFNAAEELAELLKRHVKTVRDELAKVDLKASPAEMKKK